MPRAKGKINKKAASETAKGVGVGVVIGDAAAEANGSKNGVGDALVVPDTTTVNDVAMEEEAAALAKTDTLKGGRGRRAAENKLGKEEIPAKKGSAKGKGKNKKADEVVEVMESGESNSNGFESLNVDQEQQEIVAKSKSAAAVGKGKRGARGAAAVKENVLENGDATEEIELPDVAIAKPVNGRGGKKVAKNKTEDLKDAEAEGNDSKPEEPESKVQAKKAGGRKRKADDKAAAIDNAIEKESEASDHEIGIDPDAKSGAKKESGRKKNTADDKTSAEVESAKEANDGKSLFDILKEETLTLKNGDSSGLKESVIEISSISSEEVVEVKEISKKPGGRKKKVEETVMEKETNGGGTTEKDVLDEEEEPLKKKGRTGRKIATAAVNDSATNEGEEQLQKKSAGRRGAKSDVTEQEVEKKITKRGAKTQELPKEDNNAAALEKKTTKRGRAVIAAKTAVTNITSNVKDTLSNEEDAPKKRARKEPSVEKELKPSVEKPPKKAGRAAGGGRRKLEKVDEGLEEQKNEETGNDNASIADADAPANIATEDILPAKKSEKATATTGRGGRKRAAPSTNNSKKDTATDVDSNGTRSSVVVVEVNDDDEAEGSKSSKAKKKRKESPTTTTTTIAAAGSLKTYNKEDFLLPPLTEGQSEDQPRFNLKISSWNVAGLRAWVKKDGLKFLEYEEPDIFCLQETKCVTDQLPEEVERIPGYHPYWLCMPGGYAGVAIYSKIMPINVEYGIGNKEFDDVGRVIIAEYEKFFLINVYVPNSGRKLVNLEPRMRWEKLFQEFVQKYNARKPVVVCGDMNVSHLEIDLANPKANVRNAGFTKEERDKMTELLSLGYVDTFRHLYPDRKGAYTFWTYMANSRSRNVGWRLDYFIVSERLVKRVVDNCIRSQCMGSDHCPITLFLKL